jgi:ElaB/YqjD/DUF883 family membrane-anchored ribosome-binding protein
MDQRDDQIMKDIDDTRAAMNEKIGIIGSRVHETMEGTKSTIDNVMDNAKRIQDTVEQTKSTIDNILATIKDSMDETIERVRYTADLIEQVNQNPWIMFGGAILAGYVLSSINRDASLGERHAPESQRDNAVPRSSAAPHDFS